MLYVYCIGTYNISLQSFSFKQESPELDKVPYADWNFVELNINVPGNVECPIIDHMSVLFCQTGLKQEIQKIISACINKQVYLFLLKGLVVDLKKEMCYETFVKVCELA